MNSVKVRDIIPPEKIDSYVPMEGPVYYSYDTRNFVLNPMTDEKGERQNWITSRLMYQWRQLVYFREIKGLTMASLPASESVDRKRDNDRDERMAEITAEWVLLENSLCASALGLSDPKEAKYIKTLPICEKLKIIAIQDRLNGFDLIQHLAKIENEIEKHKAFTEAHQKIVEERAEFLAQMKYEEKIKLEKKGPKNAKKPSRGIPGQL